MTKHGLIKRLLGPNLPPLVDTAQEVAEGITIKEGKDEDITTDSGDESEAQFNYDSQSDFDDDVDGDEDEGDENM